MKKFELMEIIRDGGATLDGGGRAVHYSRGYQVSRRDCYVLDVSNVDAILRAVNELLRNGAPGDFVGVWIDGGRAYIDISERVERLSDAMRLGIERAQKSIFQTREASTLNLRLIFVISNEVRNL